MSPARNRVRRRRQEPTDLGSLLDADLGMVTLVAGSTKLGVHRAVLAARSAPLAAMLRRLPPAGGDGCPELALPDLDGPVLVKLVGYVYALKLNRLDGLGPQLLAAADRYSVVGLRDAVQSRMAEERLAHSRLHAMFLRKDTPCLQNITLDDLGPQAADRYSVVVLRDAIQNLINTTSTQGLATG